LKIVQSKWFNLVLCVVVASLSLLAGILPLAAQGTQSIAEEVEWTWEVRPSKPDLKLPNVLLLGDSITRNYFPQVKKDLDGVANVYLLATSASVGDPRLEAQIKEFLKLEKVRFRVVHFNNGMHGWGYTEEEYKIAFPQLIRSAKSLRDKQGVLIWTSTTPVKVDNADGPTIARVDERNKIALELVKASRVTVDDQHALMLRHEDLFADSVHFNEAGSNLMGDRVAESVRAALQEALTGPAAK